MLIFNCAGTAARAAHYAHSIVADVSSFFQCRGTQLDLFTLAYDSCSIIGIKFSRFEQKVTANKPVHVNTLILHEDQHDALVRITRVPAKQSFHCKC
jgi:hypothetical protein